jgi:hypothetical protein
MRERNTQYNHDQIIRDQLMAGSGTLTLTFSLSSLLSPLSSQDALPVLAQTWQGREDPRERDTSCQAVLRHQDPTCLVLAGLGAKRGHTALLMQREEGG